MVHIVHNFHWSKNKPACSITGQRSSRVQKWWICVPATIKDKHSSPHIRTLWITLLKHQGWMCYNIKVLLSNMRFCYFSCQVMMLGPKWVMRPLVHCAFLFHPCISGVACECDSLLLFLRSLQNIQTIWVTVIVMIARRAYNSVWRVLHDLTKVIEV